MVSRSWSDAYNNAPQTKRVCKRSIGYDANTLCLSTMLREMPCGKERVMHYRNSAGASHMLTGCLKPRTWFESVEVDIEISEPLWLQFKEIPPFYVTKQIPNKAVLQHMKDYLQRIGRKRVTGKLLLRRCQCKSCCCMLQCYVGMQNTVQSSKPFIARSTIRWRKSSLGLWSRWQRPGALEVWTRVKLCLLKCSNCWETVTMGNSLRHWSGKQAWSTRWMKVVDRSLQSADFSELNELGHAN